MCWHVFGLLHRNERNFNEAIKAYKRALFIDKDNLNILRDLSLLQIQMRDLTGFQETRTTILQLRPSLKVNWMALAIANHLTGNLTGAIEVIDTYLRTLKEDSEELGRCFESSELALYKNSIIAELPNNYQQALDQLRTCEDVVVDRGAWLLRKAEYLLKLGDFKLAHEAVLSLFDRGMTENYRAHSIFMCAMLKADSAICDRVLKLRGTQTLATMIPLSAEQKVLLLNAYRDELQPRFAKSYAATYIPITLMDGENFRQAIDQLCRRHLSRGVPSLYQELRSFLWIEKDGRLERPEDPVEIRDHPLFKLYCRMADEYIDSLAQNSKLSLVDVEEAPQSTLFWAWYLRAGLNELAADYQQALSMIDRCIEHDSTAVDSYVLKARILSLSGDFEGAVKSIDAGRELDRQDRYMNNETTRYMLQAGMEDQALKTISLFAKHEGNPEQNLFDMQCSWYELEVAACHLKKQDYGRSLKKYGMFSRSSISPLVNSSHREFHLCSIRLETL
jgi:N-alpha-acetyltransferase 15/16, NatA auxiliary subunit